MKVYRIRLDRGKLVELSGAAADPCNWSMSGVNDMPKVGSGKGAKDFPYTAKGAKAAKKYAKKTGKKVTKKKGMGGY